MVADQNRDHGVEGGNCLVREIAEEEQLGNGGEIQAGSPGREQQAVWGTGRMDGCENNKDRVRQGKHN